MSLFWGIVIVVVADAIAITAMLLVRRRAPEGSFFTDGDRASGVFGVLATCFAIFAGFVIFLAFTTYDQSLAGADAEALIVVQQFETAQFLPDETRSPRRAARLLRPLRSCTRSGREMEAGDQEQRDQPVGGRAVPHDPRRRTRRRPRSRRRSPSGSTRPRTGRRRVATASTARPASRRPRSGSCSC